MQLKEYWGIISLDYNLLFYTKLYLSSKRMYVYPHQGLHVMRSFSKNPKIHLLIFLNLFNCGDIKGRVWEHNYDLFENDIEILYTYNTL